MPTPTYINDLIPKPTKWECKDGTILDIKDMSTSHISNCIRMIKVRKMKWRAEWLEPLRKELTKRLIP